MIPSAPAYTPEVIRTTSPSANWLVFILTSYPGLLGTPNPGTQFDIPHYLCFGQDPLDVGVFGVAPQNYFVKTLATYMVPA